MGKVKNESMNKTYSTAYHLLGPETQTKLASTNGIPMDHRWKHFQVNLPAIPVARMFRSGTRQEWCHFPKSSKTY